MTASAAFTLAVAIVAATSAAAAPVSTAAVVIPAAPVSAQAPASTACVASTGSFSWGFKESFRAYVSGSIANGEWSTDGGITYATPAFLADELTGEVQLDTLAGELAVEGSMRFTGHDGILDTTIADPRLQFDGAGGIVMVVDVTGTTQDFVEVSAADVPFVIGDVADAEWSVDGELLVIDAVPLTLTAEGADAFGTYPEGEPFDALTVTLDAGAECAAAVLDARATTGVPLAQLVAIALALGGAAMAGALIARGRRTRPNDGE